MSQLKGLVLTSTHVQFRDWCALNKLNYREYKPLTKPDDLMGMNNVPVFQGHGRPVEYHRIIDQLNHMGMKVKTLDGDEVKHATREEKILRLEEFALHDVAIKKILFAYKDEITFDSLLDLVLYKQEQYENVFNDHLRHMERCPPRIFVKD